MVQPGGPYGAGSVGTAVSGGVTKSSAIWAHPPDGGRTLLSWVLRLPDVNGLKLGWSAGLGDGAFSQDGVDFHVRVNGVTYWQVTAQSNHWIPGTLDLSKWKGQNVLVELMTDSRGDHIFDWAYWADVVLSGSTTTCSYSVAAGASTAAAGGTFSTGVTATATCPWSTSSSVPWVTITSGSGSGNGTVSYSVAPNPGVARSGALTIAGQTFTVSQAAASGSSLIQNGNFSSGTTGWLTFGTPDSSYMESNVTNGVFQFRRVPQPLGQPVSQAVIFQNTGVALSAGTAMTATFQLGNTSSARKYMKVLLVADGGFSDMAACTFWLDPNAPLRTYQMKAYTTQAWTDAAVYFYASSPNTDGGDYQVDNVSFAVTPGGVADADGLRGPAGAGAAGGRGGAEPGDEREFRVRAAGAVDDVRDDHAAQSDRRERAGDDPADEPEPAGGGAERDAAGDDGQPDPDGDVPVGEQQRGAHSGRW